MTKDEAMKLALDALEEYKYAEARTALREALSQSSDESLDEPNQLGDANLAQEPVAWISEGGDVARSKAWMDEMGFACSPLYTAPPRRDRSQERPEWVSLTSEDIDAAWKESDDKDNHVFEVYTFAHALDAILKEKNHG